MIDTNLPFSIKKKKLKKKRPPKKMKLIKLGVTLK